jgi:hypothetical protein
VDADLAEPQTRRRLIEFPAGVAGADLPVEFPGHQVVVHVTIGARKVDFALDTGASGIYIDSSLASDLHLPLINTSTQFVAGRFTAHQTIVPEIVAGTVRMHDIVVNVVPVDFRENEYIKVQGLLGFDFLAQLGVTIDYEHKIVHVVPAEAYVPPAADATRAITIRLGSQVPMTTVRVGNAVAEHILFDTGWGAGNLAFFDYFARRYPSAFKANLGQLPMQGIGGALAFRNFVGTLVPAGAFTFDGDGVIGDGLISLFTVGLDYTNAQIYLTPNSAGAADMRR